MAEHFIAALVCFVIPNETQPIRDLPMYGTIDINLYQLMTSLWNVSYLPGVSLQRVVPACVMYMYKVFCLLLLPAFLSAQFVYEVRRNVSQSRSIKMFRVFKFSFFSCLEGDQEKGLRFVAIVKLFVSPIILLITPNKISFEEKI